MFNASNLNEYSRKIAQMLFAEHPNWRDYAKIDTSEHVDSGSLLIIIPSPHDDQKGGLYISTDESAIRINFDAFHTHFGNWEGITAEEAFREALTCIHAIFDETLLVMVTRYENRISEVRLINKCDKISLKERKTISIRSWYGTYNQDMK